MKAVLVALLVFGAKLTLISQFAGEAPLNDQWNSEGGEIFLPMLRGAVPWSAFVAPSNEHRILPTRLLAAAHFAATGHQWDPTLQLAISAAVFALWLALLAAWLMRITPPRSHLCICILMTLIGALPFAYENTLWAIESHFYFLLLFSALAAWGMLRHRPFRLRWWIGVLSGSLAVLSTGSGGLAGGAILVVLVARWINHRKVSLHDLPTALIAMGFIVAAMWLRADVRGHAKYAADSWPTFSAAFARLAAWPFSANIAMAVILWLPLGVFIIRGVGPHKRTLGKLGETILFLAAFVLIQIAAMAWARGNILAFMTPSSRYTDVLALGLVANVVALIWLRGTQAGRGPAFLFSVWLFIAAAGLVQASFHVAVDFLGQWRRASNLETEQLNLFFRTGDISKLVQARAWDPSCPVSAAWLRETPSSLPPALQSRPPNGFSFTPSPHWQEGGFDPRVGPPGGYIAWGSWSPTDLHSQGNVVVSTPFSIDKGALAFSYVCSQESGACMIEFVDATGSVAAAVDASQPPGTDPFWQVEWLKISPGKYQMRIHDRRAAGWIAVTPPRQVSRLGYLARRLLDAGALLFAIAGIGLSITLTTESREHRHTQK